VKAPSVRTPVLPGYQPSQYVFFLQPHQKALPGQLLGRWDLHVEFLDTTQQPLTPHTTFIDWRRPRFRLVSGRGVAAAGLPAFPPRPGAVAYQPNQWYPVEVNWA
jgi:hypothetical protein